MNKLYFDCVTLYLTSIISANYWRKATYSWRRTLDLVFAKFSFVVFVSKGALFVRKIYYIIPGYTGLVILIYCYYLSGKRFELKKDDWYKYHFAFHFIMTYELIIIIDSILKTNF
jgi:hypothetical protein